MADPSLVAVSHPSAHPSFQPQTQQIITRELRLALYSVCQFRSMPHILLFSAQNFSNTTGERPRGLTPPGVIKAQCRSARELLKFSLNLLVTAPVPGPSEDDSLCYSWGSSVPLSIAVTLITYLMLVFLFPSLLTPVFCFHNPRPPLT